MIIFSVEDIRTVASEIVERLAEDNFQESGLLQGQLELKVNIPAYINDHVRVFTMRTEDETLVGYAIFFVIEHPHFKGSVFALNDVIYIKPEFRKDSSVDFFKFIEQELDVDVINYSMNYSQPHMKLMQSLGFEPTEIVYHKVVRNV